MDAVQTDQRSAVYLFLTLTLILVPITIVSLLVSTALPLTLVAIARRNWRADVTIGFDGAQNENI